jgi:hypothetical protein
MWSEANLATLHYRHEARATQGGEIHEARKPNPERGNTMIEAAGATHEQIVALARDSPSLPSLRRPSTIVRIF